MVTPNSIYSVDKLIEQARQLAADYKKMMGKPLPGVSNEIAEHDAARLMELTLCEDRTQGFDARRLSNNGPKRIQIKARVIFNDNYRGQRLGQLKLDKQWDSVVLVLMNADYQAIEIFESSRDDVLENLQENTSRMKRGAMSVARFRNIAKLVWTQETGLDRCAWGNEA